MIVEVCMAECMGILDCGCLCHVQLEAVWCRGNHLECCDDNV